MKCKLQNLQIKYPVSGKVLVVHTMLHSDSLYSRPAIVAIDILDMQENKNF